MKHTGGILPLNSQKPTIQLLVSLMAILFISLVLVGIAMLLGRVIFGIGINEIDTGMGAINSTQRAYIKFIQAMQHLGIFMAPALFVAYLMTGNMAGYLKINILPGWLQAFLVIFLALILIPVISDLGIWNSKLSLPPFLSGLEEWMKVKEEEAGIITKWLIYSGTTGGLIVNVLIIAVIPAIGEEFLFRGLFQNIFTQIFRSPHAGIVFTALLFSAFHLQFYGLIPRMALGIVYGYLFFWSKTLWLPVLAHLINNLVPVIIAHFVGWEKMNTEIQDFIYGEGYMFFIPLTLAGMLMFAIRDQSKFSNSEK